MSVNKFVLNETSYFGKGAREELPEEIRKRKFNKVLVVTDKALFECGVTARVTEVLDRAGIETRVGLPCSPSSHKTLGTFPRGTLRFSPGPFTTKDEINETLTLLKEIMENA